jgi:hypothetical protein
MTTFDLNRGSTLRLFSKKLHDFHERRAAAFNASRSPDMPAEHVAKFTVEMVPILLDAYGYRISVKDYAEVEGGRRLPDNPSAFIEAISFALDLTHTETAQLASCLVVDLLSTTLTIPVALEILLYLIEDDPCRTDGDTLALV